MDTVTCVECGEECHPNDPLWLYQRRDRSQPIHHDCNLKEHRRDNPTYASLGRRRSHD